MGELQGCWDFGSFTMKGVFSPQRSRNGARPPTPPPPPLTQEEYDSLIREAMDFLEENVLNEIREAERRMLEEHEDFENKKLRNEIDSYIESSQVSDSDLLCPQCMRTCVKISGSVFRCANYPSCNLEVALRPTS